MSAASQSAYRKPEWGVELTPEQVAPYIAHYAKLVDDPQLFAGLRAPGVIAKGIIGPRGAIRPRHEISSCFLESNAPGLVLRPYAASVDEVIIGMDGRHRIRWGSGDDCVVELGELDAISIPAGVERRIENASGGVGRTLALLEAFDDTGIRDVPVTRTMSAAGMAPRIAHYANTGADPKAFADVQDPATRRDVRYVVGRHTAYAGIKVPHKLSVATVESNPGRGPKLHWHDYPEIFMTVRGRYGIVWGNQGEHCVTLDRLDVFATPEGVMRSVMNHGEGAGINLVVFDSTRNDPNEGIRIHPEEHARELAAGRDYRKEMGLAS
jgi:uncharacterized RmlC-like cupin family protein